MRMLVVNEFIKQFANRTTYLMLILTLLAGLAVGVLFKVDEAVYYSDEDSVGYRNTAYLHSDDKMSGKSELVIPKNDWRGVAAMNYLAAKELETPAGDEAVLKLKTLINGNDPAGYYQYMESKLSAAKATLIAGNLITDEWLLSDARGGALCSVSAKLMETQLRIRLGCYENSGVELDTNLLGLSDLYENVFTTLPEELDTTDNSKNKTYQEYRLLKYQLENSIPNNLSDDMGTTYDNYEDTSSHFWMSLDFTSKLISFAGILMIVIAGNIIAGEFSRGTIKFLVINPVRRWKIFVAKYITVLGLGLIAVLMLYLGNLIVSLIAFDPSQHQGVCLVFDGTDVKEIAPAVMLLKNALFNLLNLVLITTLAFMVSAFLRNTGFAIGVSMFALLSGYTIVAVLKTEYKVDWVRYTMFANLRLERMFDDSVMFPGQTTTFSLVVLCVNWFLMMFIAWDAFTRTEIK
ncbi:MAG: ABC transporter permease [Oscillospiraceae bacterium]